MLGRDVAVAASWMLLRLRPSFAGLFLMLLGVSAAAVVAVAAPSVVLLR